jgi:hypothetical protein
MMKRERTPFGQREKFTLTETAKSKNSPRITMRHVPWIIDHPSKTSAKDQVLQYPSIAKES